MSPGAYIPNSDFEAEFNASAEALDLVRGIAEAAVPLAKAGAPKRLGHLADSIEAEAGVVDGTATGRLNAHDFKAGWKEFGTASQPAEPYLRPAMEAITGSPVKGGRS